MLQVAHEARLVDREQRTESHRARRELPEVRHEPRVRIRRQALAARLTAVVVEALLPPPAFEERSRIHFPRRMRLEVDEIAAIAGAGEMVEADFEEIRRRCVARDV